MYNKINESERRKKLIAELTNVKNELNQREADAKAKAETREEKIKRINKAKDEAWLKKQTNPKKVEKNTISLFDFMAKTLVEHARKKIYTTNIAYTRSFNGHSGEMSFGEDIVSQTKKYSGGQAIIGPLGCCFSISKLKELCEETGIEMDEHYNNGLFSFSCSEIIDEITEKQKTLYLEKL